MKSTSGHNNPYHPTHPADANDASVLLTLKQGVEHELDDFVALELTAERMAEDEAALLGAYINDDATRVKGFWQDLKAELDLLETSTGRFLLTAADPTRTEWYRNGWWLSEEDERDYH